ncbi:hypothetical protein Slala03_68990 [Streptomyces lavendulae subsp. lavendulae]|nr:hypothetical protein Slala03_68990 [Streptomyces lavendulae subsp. lavendulae]
MQDQAEKARTSLRHPPLPLSPVTVLLGVSRQSLAFRGGTGCQGWPKAIAKRRDRRERPWQPGPTRKDDETDGKPPNPP